MDQKKIGYFLRKRRKYAGFCIEEILDGERKAPASEKEEKNTLLKVADYSTNENIPIQASRMSDASHGRAASSSAR